MGKHLKTIGVIFGIAIIVVLLDFRLSGVIFIKKATISQSIADFIIVTLAGITGYLLAIRTNLPIWWRNGDEDNTKGRLILPGLSLIIIVVNSYISISDYLSNKASLIMEQPWVEDLTPLSAFLISLRSALTEEIIFRLLMVSTIIYLLKFFITNKKTRNTISIVFAALMYGIIQPVFAIPFFFGLILAYAYIKYGLIPVLTINLLASLIPLFYISLIK